MTRPPFTTLVAHTAPATLHAAGWHPTYATDGAISRFWHSEHGDVTFSATDAGPDLLRASVDSPQLARVLALLEGSTLTY